MAETEKPTTEKPTTAKPTTEKPITEKPNETPKSSNTTIERSGVKFTGFSAAGETRRVRVLERSYVNDALHEVGAITHWPAGVEVLGRNLEEFKG